MGFAGRGRGRGRGRGGFDRGRGGRGGGRGGYGQPQWGDSPNGGPGGNDYGSGGQFTDYVAVPSNKCGLIIGKGIFLVMHLPLRLIILISNTFTPLLFDEYD